jgi:hypothetical protein
VFLKKEIWAMKKTKLKKYHAQSMSEKNAQGMRKKKKKKERIAHVQNKKGKREV